MSSSSMSRDGVSLMLSSAGNGVAHPLSARMDDPSAVPSHSVLFQSPGASEMNTAILAAERLFHPHMDL